MYPKSYDLLVVTLGIELRSVDSRSGAFEARRTDSPEVLPSTEA